jgi:hypothetical protein
VAEEGGIKQKKQGKYIKERRKARWKKEGTIDWRTEREYKK